jgi:hypothetical protein
MYLLKCLKYDQDIGTFTWIIKPSARVNIGDVAGWVNNGYYYVGLNGYQFLAHRLAWFYMKGVWPENEIDHKDNIKLNNFFSNIRDVTRSTNLQNRPIPQSRKMSSAMPGVYSKKALKKPWYVQLYIAGKKTFFGTFSSQEEAEEKCLELRRLYYPGNIL